MSSARTLIVYFKSNRPLNEDEIDIDEDVYEAEDEDFDFSENGNKQNTLKRVF